MVSIADASLYQFVALTPQVDPAAGAPAAPQMTVQDTAAHAQCLRSCTCRQCWKLDHTVPWRRISSLTQLQQLLKIGPTDRSTAAAVLSEVLQVVRCVLSALDSPSMEMQLFAESVLRIAESKCGVNREVSKEVLIQKCKEVEKVVGHVVVDSSDPPPTESNAQMILDHLVTEDRRSGTGELLTKAWAPSNLASLEAFFMCGLRSLRLLPCCTVAASGL